jgi:PAS domain-containing protein
MVNQPIELILLRQWASYLSIPIWLVASSGDLLFYNEAAEPLIGRRFDEQGAIRADQLSDIFSITGPDGEPLSSDELPIVIALTQRRPVHRRIRIEAMDGVPRELEVTALPIEGLGQEHLGAVAFFWEVAQP